QPVWALIPAPRGVSIYRQDKYPADGQDWPDEAQRKWPMSRAWTLLLLRPTLFFA
ncbi:hypothetical protein KR018_002512, partial [Drosophila ironensis]